MFWSMLFLFSIILAFLDRLFVPFTVFFTRPGLVLTEGS